MKVCFVCNYGEITSVSLNVDFEKYKEKRGIKNVPSIFAGLKDAEKELKNPGKTYHIDQSLEKNHIRIRNAKLIVPVLSELTYERIHKINPAAKVLQYEDYWGKYPSQDGLFNLIINLANQIS